MSNKKLIVFSGPTGVGKTDLSIEIAMKYALPIISADSRQVYKEVNIGTAKPSMDQLSKVKHYFIDHINVDVNYSVGQYVQEAQVLIQDLFKVYDKVLICGGTGLYIQALLNGLDHFPEIIAEVRLSIQQNYEQQGLHYLATELVKLDPSYFQSVDQNNPRRLMRALEVCLSTGNTYSSYLKRKENNLDYSVKEIFLNIERKTLYERINTRVDQMMSKGLLNELLALKKYRSNQALNTVGYKELLKYIDKEWGLEEAVEKVKQHTRNYAKRQITWFNKYSNGITVQPDDWDKIIDYIES